MTRWQPGPPPDSGRAVVGKPAALPALNPEVLEILASATAAITRRDAARYLLDAMAAGLPLADAVNALADWDRANPTQQIRSQR